MDEGKMIALAAQAREMAYAPYSRFRVGACLLTGDGSFFIGCNVENVSFGATNCAERTAAFTAVAQGQRDFTAIAVVTGHSIPVWPCGLCMQVLWEFGGPDMTVIAATVDGKTEKRTLSELMPRMSRGYVPTDEEQK